MSELALEIRGLSKAFGGAQALSGVDLTLRRGEIHALLGENGAGKSTLIKILAGVVARDAGTIVAGSGLAFVHQDLGLIDELSVAENIALELGYTRRRGLISFAATSARVAALLESVGVDVSPSALVGSLAQDQKVMVAVTRAVSAGAGAIVLDEVSSSLPAPEMARLAASLRAARKSGVAYIYVTHRLEEVFDLADRVTVLRDGRRVATADVADVSHDGLVSWILGDALEPAVREERPLGEVALRVDGAVSFDVRAGEILGVCGLIGSGSRDVARVLGGAASGDCSATLHDHELPLGDPYALAQAGVAYVPGDRVREGAVLDLAVRENLFLARRPRGERAAAAELVRRFDVRPRDAVERPLASLSGGNQQKVIFARALHAKPRLLVLDDPTAGVDVGSRLALHGFLRECAADGAAIVLASTDFEEIAAVADRALVMRHGRVADELSRDQLTAERLARAAYGSSNLTEVTL
ncbi:sugar ABC transporter ATP-binding protein [Solirubrobacter ginsenosidimutans]|uniref:Sugar ABC transporter ATP-binding protein n=1 Tax=Solirubrobacter ginsenosidimutans TaxID=490573 RepID=A0A9X3S0K2_9ACTN|nr:sugar ABC transporter ATP-binding protein [Solirubrobacter ginsenosidimutans]MDA0162135.1 sugar ABC transporter ATP-binding protein [Solirubrobacter ginsenosidimutans]